MTPAPKPAHGASVRPRPRRDGTTAYDVRYRHEGSSRTLSFTSAKAAEKWAGIVRKVGPVEAIAFLNLNTTAGSPTLTEYAETYIASKSGVEGKTTEHYRMFMRLHIGPALGHYPIDAISPGTISAWINECAATGAAAKTIKNWHGFLSAALQNAADDDLIARNPCTKTNLPESEVGEMVFLTPDEFVTLLGCIPERHHPLVLLLVGTGVRWGEATALRPSDFDLDRETVRISRAWKSSAARGWYIGAPKTRRSRRTLSLPPDLVPILRPLVDGASEYVFTNTRGKPVRQQNFFSQVWAPARRLANGMTAFEVSKKDATQPWHARPNGVWSARKPLTHPLGKSPRIHDLRHTNASWLLEQGVGIDVVSRRLGHESITTTVDRYGHVSAERMHGAGAAVGIAMAGALPQIVT